MSPASNPLESAARRAAAAGMLLLAAALSTAPAAAQVSGPVYPVTAFEIEYALDHPDQVPVEELLDLEVGLRSTPEAYVAPRPVDRTVRMRLSSLPRNARFSAPAIQHISQHIVSTLNRRGYHGVIVSVPEIEASSGLDLRPPGRTTLLLRVWTGRVSRLTTVADGERFAGLTTDERTDNAAHDWMRERAPVQPGGARALLDVEALEDYAAELSRHPGRRVDVELSAGERPGTTDVNLRVAESKPWYAYAQYANTGTEATTKNRERFGLVHNQLLGRDDILRVDYVTGDFDSVHSAVAEYEAPFTLRAPDWRWSLRGWYSEYDASEVGFSNGRFTGEQFAGDVGLRVNVYQRRELFVDVTAGARFQQMHVKNYLFDDSARATYLVPQLGLAGERNTRTSTLRFALGGEGGLTDTDETDLAILGRDRPSQDFALLRLDGSYAFYLEPLLDRAAWEDPSTPGSSTLAHEVAVLVRGQWAFGYRLVPQYQQIAGGLYTVRGYNQAEAAGDNLGLGSLEYRFHLPRIFSPDPTPPEVPGMGEFRTRPQHVWGYPDWDLILRAFTDAAYLTQSDRRDNESNELLWSAGAGVELQVLRNLTVRFDWGYVLKTVGDSERGDTRGHLVATLLY
ncbi:MAG TPA: ShlB/FhaC/HecB family hemolysin secretion/activation protein [Myxococcota bacterium]